MSDSKSRGLCFTCLGEVWDWMPYTIDSDGILQHKDPGYCIQPLKAQVSALRARIAELEAERMPASTIDATSILGGMKILVSDYIPDDVIYLSSKVWKDGKFQREFASLTNLDLTAVRVHA